MFLERLQKWAVGVLMSSTSDSVGDMRCIVGIVLGPSRTRNTIFNGSKLIGQSWAETDTPFPM